MADQNDETYALDAYVNQIRNTVYAAYEDHDETDVHERLEGLLYEFRENYDPQVDSQAAFERELDALVRGAYVPGDQLVEVLEEKTEELEELGSGGPPLDGDVEGAPDPEGLSEDGGDGPNAGDT